MSLHPGVGYVALGVVLGAILVPRLNKTETRRVVTGTVLFFVSLALLALSSVLRDAGLTQAASFLRSLALFSEGFCVIYLVAVLLFRGLLPRVRLVTPLIVQDVVIALAVLVWGVFWLRANHVDLTSIVATSAVVTAVIAFSLQDTLGNILGGIAIQLDQSIQVGDWVEVDGSVGRVADIRWRHTSIETRNWETMVVPNSHLVKNNFRVLGRRQGEPMRWRRSVSFGVGFEVPPNEVIEAVQSALRASDIPCVAKYPQPVCLMINFGSSAADYQVRYWLDDLTQDDPVDSDVRQVIFFALRRAGMEPCIPAQSVHLIEENDERQQSREQSNLRERVESLRRVDLFETLQEDELEWLAGRLQPAPFARGALMTRQGEAADWLYLLLDGRADVLLERPDGDPIAVAELGPGSFFGEMGLMTGEPRSATVIARSRVNACRLDKAAFQEVLQARPEIAEEISAVLAQRQAELQTLRESNDGGGDSPRRRAAIGALLNRIQTFFGLEEGRSGRRD